MNFSYQIDKTYFIHLTLLRSATSLREPIPEMSGVAIFTSYFDKL